MANFGPKPWTNPFGKKSSFQLFKHLVFIPLKRPFSVLEYDKTHFSALYCVKKKREKMANFGPKPWTNPFGKMSISRLFELLVSIV